MGKKNTAKDACMSCKLKDQCPEVGGCGLLKLYLDQSEDTLNAGFAEIGGVFQGDFHEINFSSFGDTSREGKESDIIDKFDAEEVRQFFSDIESDHLPIGVQMFYDTICKGFTFKDLAEKHGWDESSVRSSVFHVAGNLKTAIRYITKKQLYIRRRKALGLPKSIQYFLAMYVDDLTVEEIATEFEVSKSVINISLGRTRELLDRGQIVLKLEENDLVLKRLKKPGSKRPMPEEVYFRKSI